MKPPLNPVSSNDFQTPPYALLPLLKYLKKEWTIWECAEGKGNITQELFSLGYNVIGSDVVERKVTFKRNLKEIGKNPSETNNISESYSGKDFLKWQPSKLKESNLFPNQMTDYDCIITNPPYSLKQQFLKRCYELGKPFALLLPLTTFETGKRQELFKKYGLEVIMFDKRINFETPSGKGSGSWFATAWFTNGLNLEKELYFVKLDECKNNKDKWRKY